jgi:hypothetical protein
MPPGHASAGQDADHEREPEAEANRLKAAEEFFAQDDLGPMF